MMGRVILLSLLACPLPSMAGCGEEAPTLAVAALPLQAAPAPQRLPPPALDHRWRHPLVSAALQDLAEACLAPTSPACRDRLAAWQADLVDGRLLVQVDLQAGLRADTLDPAALAAVDGAVITRGRDVVDVRLPPGALLTYADLDPAISWLRLPQRPEPTVGQALSEGVERTRAASYHCTDKTAAGVHVAVLDSGFGGIGQAVLTGDIPADVVLPKGKIHPGQTHGTLCLEVVADMAPGATLHAISVPTLGWIQKLAWDELPTSPIKVLSHSMTWFGQGFGDNSGKLCRIAEKIRSEGVALLSSAGNSGHKRFWRGKFTDADGDGWHEFTGDDIHNAMVLLPGQKFRAILDWDEYPGAKTDLDLYFCRLVAGKCQPFEQSTSKQTGKQSPYESVAGKVIDSGFYSLAIHRKAGSAAPTMRIYLLDGVALKYHNKDHSVGEPASCTAAVAVAAVPWQDYEQGPLANYSSHGPTEDGRIKPDITGPASVDTMTGGSFSGTSASCPHVAGAVALYLAATPTDAISAVEKLLADAVPMTDDAPDTGWGHGRMVLDAGLSGATCHPGEQVSCETACGSAGFVECAPGCQGGTCTAPKEKCNGKDDDCDGQTDEGFACAEGSSKVCVAKCGAEGVSKCMSNCKWSACTPALEQDPCDGVDNDCDGQTDEDSACPPGQTGACTTACASVGETTCTAACEPGICEAPAETCNGFDDDCDGTTDEESDCAAGLTGECKTDCGSKGTRQCAADCSWSSCSAPAETCNDRDDDCDGAVDEGLDCGGCSASPDGSRVAPGAGRPLLLLSVLALLFICRRRRSALGVRS